MGEDATLFKLAPWWAPAARFLVISLPRNALIGAIFGAVVGGVIAGVHWADGRPASWLPVIWVAVVVAGLATLFGLWLLYRFKRIADRIEAPFRLVWEAIACHALYWAVLDDLQRVNRDSLQQEIMQMRGASKSERDELRETLRGRRLRAEGAMDDY